MQDTIPFENHMELWLLYLGCGLVFMLLVWWKARKWPFWLQLPVVTALCAGAFSFTQIEGYSTYGPTVIAFILQFETETRAQVPYYATQIIVVWFLLMALTLGIRYLMGSKSSTKETDKSEPELKI
ncbi:hypothetical protein [Pleionea sp. CnH1-48]|uniref:hypothetical protein n=1 Tax=Pleionea sp. CnH1-48 TaxID=2954494 RepID=UPI002096EAF7|nr:hypothetical protein [Pleionea sp. CnH1-48]MCO7222919.1 hypothetical protein [Pleionea sp. CnH1-48]